MATAKCPYCDEEFEITHPNKKFCCYACNDNYHRLVRLSGLNFMSHLTPEERILREKLLKYKAKQVKA